MKNLERMRLEVNKRMEAVMLEIIKILDDMNSRKRAASKGRAAKLNTSK
jgi:hypothetical protein